MIMKHDKEVAKWLRNGKRSGILAVVSQEVMPRDAIADTYYISVMRRGQNG